MHTLNFWVANDAADLLERLLAGFLNFVVRIGEHFDESRHDARQTRGELLRGAVGHGAEQLDGAALGAP